MAICMHLPEASDFESIARITLIIVLLQFTLDMRNVLRGRCLALHLDLV